MSSFRYSLALSMSLVLTPASLLAKQAKVDTANASPNMLQYKDTFNLEYATAPFFSPDGASLYYQRRAADIMTDSTKTSLWRIDLATMEQFPVMAEGYSISSPVLSPDGTKLAYLAKYGGNSQIFLLYLSTGESAKLTNLIETPSDLAWSGDGKHLAFTMFTKAESKPLFKGMPAKPKGAKWAASAKYIEQTAYRADGHGYLPNGYNQIYILPATGGTPRQLTQGNYLFEGPLSFSAGNSALVFTALLEENFDMQPLEKNIYKLNIADTKMTPLTKLAGPESDAKLSPNGKLLAFYHTNDRKLAYQNDMVKVLELDNGKLHTLTTKLDRSIQDLQWESDSQGVVISYQDEGLIKLARISMEGDFETLPARLGGTTLGRPYTSGSFALSTNGDIAFTQDTFTKPADIALLKSETDSGKKPEIQTITDLNSDALGHFDLAKVEQLSVISSVDKRPIDAWIAYPPNHTKGDKLPLILEIHGGPHAAYGPHFSMEIQLMAAQGYAVAWSNPRGSSSYGEEFGNLIHHNYPSEDYNDLMDVVDAAVSTGKIDYNNLFITGGSGGGVLTAWSIGKTDRFKAAVVAKPVINWMSFTLTADAYPYFSQYWIPGLPWEHAEHLWERSPLSLVGNVTTPTMLLTGEEDYRTPISESEQFYQALRLQGVDAAMVRIPGASHGIASRPSRLIQKIGNIIAWFDRYRVDKDKSKTANNKDAVAVKN